MFPSCLVSRPAGVGDFRRANRCQAGHVPRHVGGARLRRRAPTHDAAMRVYGLIRIAPRVNRESTYSDTYTYIYIYIWLCAVCAVGRVGCCVGGGVPCGGKHIIITEARAGVDL